MYKNKSVDLVVDIVATYRLTRLIIDDRLTEELREIIYSKFPPTTTKIGYILGCRWCMSIWAGAAIFGLRKLSPQTADYVSGVLASSAIVGVVSDRGY